MGVDMIILTGNPGIGVENQAIIHALTQLKEAVGDRVILTAGKCTLPVLLLKQVKHSHTGRCGSVY